LEKLSLGDNSIFGETEPVRTLHVWRNLIWKIILYLEKLNQEDNSIFEETEPGR